MTPAIADLETDRRRARLSPRARNALIADSRRVVIVGARGWIGRTVLSLLGDALAPEIFADRVACFGSRRGAVELDGGPSVPQRPLAELRDLDSRPTLLLHLAFLTKEKVSGMAAADYSKANRALSQQVFEALEPTGTDRLFVASSGAAAFADDIAAAEDLRLYGGLKRDDETLFAAWADAAPLARRAVIARIYSVSGPHINKLETYALASFILDALAGSAIEVRAPMPVVRSYVAVRDIVSLAFASLLAEQGAPVTRFDTGGEALELGVVAQAVASALGGHMLRRPITELGENRYVGDDAVWRALLAQHAITPLSLEQQILETAAFLARTTKVDAEN